MRRVVYGTHPPHVRPWSKEKTAGYEALERHMSVRLRNALRRSNVMSINEFVMLEPEQMLRHDNFGRKTLEEMRNLQFTMRMLANELR